MTFQQRYAALEDKFKGQIEKDNECFRKKYSQWQDSHYLQTVPPEAPADFVLVAMEPSAALRADGNPDPAVVNLYASVGDFILHFCARNYLCEEGESYFTTDLAKGAMPTAQAKKTAAKRWPKWHKLLKEELELVGKQDAKVIVVGRGLETFLGNSGTPKLAGSILHWSPNARVARPIAPQLFPREYEKFSEDVNAEGLASYVEELIRDKVFDKSRDRILRDIQKSGGTESNKMLMFTYKCQFAAILGKPIT